MTKPTRNVIVDLWPLYVSGEASPDTRALIDDFIAQDREFGDRLREHEGASLTPPSLVLPADHERATLLRVQKRRARQSMLVNSLALLISAGMTAFYAWDIVPRWARTFAAASLPLPPGMHAAAQGTAWILRLGLPLVLLLVPAVLLFRKRLTLPRFLESGTALAIATGLALVLAQLTLLGLLHEASMVVETACRALPSARP
jgi:hypothetical protein